MTAPRRGSNSERINRRLKARVRTVPLSRNDAPDPYQRVTFFHAAERIGGVGGFAPMDNGAWRREVMTP